MDRPTTEKSLTVVLRCALAALLALSVVMVGSVTPKTDAWAADGSLSQATWEDVKPGLESHLDTPYVWGGKSESGWDCSGFVGWAIANLYGCGWPGGSPGECGTDAIVGVCAGLEVSSGTSADDYNAAFDNGTVKPGDIIVFSNSTGGTVHCAIAGERQTVYHAWSEHYGTCNTRFDFMWGIDGGHGKTYRSFKVYRGLTEGGYIILDKTTGDVHVTGNNAEYSLAGAVYGVFKDDVQVASITTDENGHGQTSAKLANGTYTVRETEAPAGYALTDKTYTVTVAGQDAHLACSDAPKTVRLTLVKQDIETMAAEPQGAASLDGAVYEATYRYDGQTKTVRGTTENASIIFDNVPLGDIEVRETEAPEGYLPDTRVHTFHVGADDAATAEVVFELTPSGEFTEQVKRGDLELVKVGAGDYERLAGVPFAITSMTTGESHVVVTDANGYASTASSWNAHSQDTNGATAESGIWFGTCPPDDMKGALIYDEYEIAEQPCAANADRELIAPFKVTVYRDGVTIHLGTLENAGKPHVSISKTDITTGKELPGATLQIIDAAGSVVDEWVSNDTPHEVVLSEGAYTLREEVAPNGYLVATDVVFSVVSGQVSQKVTMQDDFTKVDVIKTDIATGDALVGATLQVVDSAGEIVDTWQSDGAPYRIERLVPGDYVLRELAAPAGYDTAEDISFTVEATGEVQVVIMADAAIPAPSTNDTPGEGFDKTGVDMTPLAAATALVALAGFASLAVAMKRCWKKDEEELLEDAE